MEKPNIQSDIENENQILKDTNLEYQERIMDNELYDIPRLEEENQRIKTESEKAIRTDHLTGCQNLLALTEWQEKNQNPEKLNNIGIIYVDINKLKIANDEFGHEAGDRLIIEVAKLLKIVFVDDGVIFRKYRGDEFVIGCNNSKNINNYEAYLRTKAQEAQNIASEMYFRFKNEITKNESYIPLSFAIGVAVYDGKPHNDDDKIDNNLKDTDTRSENDMYVDKQNTKKIEA